MKRQVDRARGAHTILSPGVSASEVSPTLHRREGCDLTSGAVPSRPLRPLSEKGGEDEGKILHMCGSSSPLDRQIMQEYDVI